MRDSFGRQSAGGHSRNVYTSDTKDVPKRKTKILKILHCTERGRFNQLTFSSLQTADLSTPEIISGAVAENYVRTEQSLCFLKS